MFDTLLVANRGEIAVRILRTARELGLKTVAVYSDADAAAPHVRLADVAVRLGPAAASESYLRPELVLHAAAETGAGAIHPGYGFLSENAQFAREVEAAGIAFVGPTAAHLSVFGDKHQAREAAQAAGVPLVAGSGLLASVDEALAAAAVVGYPVMVKAVGGGGGIGMQACADADQLVAAFDRVQRLAAASFGSAGVFLERFVSRARHLEVQVFGDGAGRVVSLGDRDCSLQRRNQKVVEEAPAPALPDEVRAMLHESARALTASVAYRSAGHGRVRLRRRPRRGVVPRGQHPPPGRAPGDRGRDARRPGRVDAAAGAGRLVVPRRGARRGTRRSRGTPSRSACTRRTPARTTSRAPGCSPRSSTPTTRPSGSTPGPRPGSR